MLDEYKNCLSFYNPVGWFGLWSHGVLEVWQQWGVSVVLWLWGTLVVLGLGVRGRPALQPEGGEMWWQQVGWNATPKWCWLKCRSSQSHYLLCNAITILSHILHRALQPFKNGMHTVCRHNVGKNPPHPAFILPFWNKLCIIWGCLVCKQIWHIPFNCITNARNREREAAVKVLVRSKLVQVFLTVPQSHLHLQCEDHRFLPMLPAVDMRGSWEAKYNCKCCKLLHTCSRPSVSFPGNTFRRKKKNVVRSFKNTWIGGFAESDKICFSSLQN